MHTIDSFSGDITTDEKTLSEHSRDRSVFAVRPAAVLYPKSAADITALIKAAAREGKSVSVRAGGTCMSGGSLDQGYMLNLTRYMNKVEIDPLKQTATVEMGAYFRDIEDAAALHGLMFAPYPSSHRICGIGGMIGNNASGEQSLRYGATIDNVISLEVVLGDGSTITTGARPLDGSFAPSAIESSILELARLHNEALIKAQGNVTKIASGFRLDRVLSNGNFDLTPLFIGAQGTLGIVTRAVLKLVPTHTHHRLALACVRSLDDLPLLLAHARKYNPECIETFDDNTLCAAENTMASEVRAARTCMVSPGKLYVLIQFSEDTVEATQALMEKFLSDAGSLNNISVTLTDESMRENMWKLRRGAFTEIQNLDTGGFHAVPCIEDIIVPVEQISKLISGLEKMLDDAKIPYGFHGHIGEGSLRIIPFFDLKKATAADEIISLMQKTFELVKSCDGNICADHSDGIVRSSFLRSFYGDELFAAFEKIKQTFDPAGVLNPNKKTGGLREHIEKFLARE